MSTDIPPDVREEVDRMRQALRATVRNSRLSDEEVEESLGLRAGFLNVVFSGKDELRVAHVFGILKAIGCEPRAFFCELQRGRGQAGEPDAA